MFCPPPPSLWFSTTYFRVSSLSLTSSCPSSCFILFFEKGKLHRLVTSPNCPWLGDAAGILKWFMLKVERLECGSQWFTSPGLLKTGLWSRSSVGVCILMQERHKGALAENEIQAFSPREAEFPFLPHIFLFVASVFTVLLSNHTFCPFMSYVSFLWNCPFTSSACVMRDARTPPQHWHPLNT